MDLEPLSNENVMRCYEALRTQVAADLGAEDRRFVGQQVRDRAEALLAEIQRRQLYVKPIDREF
jgi:hypothetical protein